MQLSEYQAQAARTANHDLSSKDRQLIAVLALAGEVGEFANLVKKMVAHGHPTTYGDLANEAGDCLWYLAEVCSAFGLSLDAVGTGNIAKLQTRYPNGFSKEASINRPAVVMSDEFEAWAGQQGATE